MLEEGGVEVLTVLASESEQPFLNECSSKQAGGK